MLGWLLGTMCACGIAGGLANFFVVSLPADEKRTLPKAMQYVLIGLCASFVVPLFLSTIQSPIVVDILNSGVTSDQAISKLLVLSGFCILAALTSRNFMTSLAAKVLRLAEKADKTASEALTQTAQVKDQIEDVATEAKIAKLTANSAQAEVANQEEPDEVEVGVSVTPAARPAATNEQMTLLMEMFTSKFRRRSISGLSDKTGLPRERVKSLLSELDAQGLVTLDNNGTNSRWVITQEGRDLATASIPKLRPIGTHTPF